MHRNEERGVEPRARREQSQARPVIFPAISTATQMELLFQSSALKAQEGRFTDVRNDAILELFYSTGMRLSELRGINRADIDLLSQQVKVRGKGTQGAHHSRWRSRAAGPEELRGRTRRSRSQHTAKGRQDRVFSEQSRKAHVR